MSTNIESLILTGLLHSDEYSRKVLPHLKPEYFEDSIKKTVFLLMKNHIDKYSTKPTKESFEVELSSMSGLTETQYSESIQLIDKITGDDAYSAVSKVSVDWMVDKSEKHCLERSVYLGIMKSISIIDGTEKKMTKDAIPSILQDALAVAFDSEVGHDYLEDSEKRFECYRNKSGVKIELPLSMMNFMTKGGFEEKTLNVFIAPTGVGKTQMMTYITSQLLLTGKNVLYITLEMAEEKIGERIDAALFDCNLDDLKKYHKDVFTTKINKLKMKTAGKLIIKEYPPCSINATSIKFLLDELKAKKNFSPQIIVLDYLNIAASSRTKDSGNSYNYVKSIAEEMRALAVEKKVCLITASQTNRAGQGASDFDLTEVSECICPTSKVESKKRGSIPISDVNIGEDILTESGWTKVMAKHCPKRKKSFKITTKSGKTIVCSEDHIFPTSNGRASIKSGGIFVGAKLNTR